MDFILVTANDLRQHWPQIKSSLDAVQAKAPDDWISEDVYHALKSGAAGCHVGVVSGQFAGILVTTIRRAEFSGDSSLHVWIAHNAGDADVFEEALDMLKKTAAHHGLQKITFGSPRVGWSKRFKLLSALYEIEV